MRIIPGKTKVQIELFKGVTLVDMVIGLIGAILLIFVVVSNLPFKLVFSLIVGGITALLIARLDTEPNYIYLMNVLKHIGYPRRYEKVYEDLELVDIAENGIKDFAFRDIFEKKEEESEEEEEEYKPETKEERKARLKAQKKERKADDKILKSKTATKEEKDEIWKKRAEQTVENKNINSKNKEAKAAWYEMDDIMPFTGIADDFIEYGGLYYGAVIEIPPIEFKFFSDHRRSNAIENGLGSILRNVNPDYACNIVKLERPVNYRHYVDQETNKLDQVRKSYENGMITEDELKARVEVIYERLGELKELIEDKKIVEAYYYLVLYDSDKGLLSNTVDAALDSLRIGEMNPKRLNSKEIAVFLKYSNQLDFDERQIDYIKPEEYAHWAMPKQVHVKHRTVEVNNIITHNMRIVNYPTVVGDAWIAGVMSMPNTKVVCKCQPMDRGKAIRTLDRSLQELRSKYMNTSVDSTLIEIQNHIDTLTDLLATLTSENETILQMNVYITAYDIVQTRNDPEVKQPPVTSYSMIANLKKAVRRVYQEQGFKLNNLEFNQTNAFLGSQISGYDPMFKDGRGIPSNTIAASFPWIYAHIGDEKGFKLGYSDGVPIFIDFFRRDSERVNSNLVVIGKSGSGKSYATKSLLANLAADDSKIFILDPENEYTELANNLHGKFINVGNAQFGRLNPFHIITALDDDESDGSSVSGSYATHLQFLEEFFKQIIPDCEKDAMEYLNSMIDRTYAKKGITADTDLSTLRPEDYPIFDDLYDNILFEFQSTDNEYIRTMLRTLMNYIAKFSSGGRNANIWNGPSTITTEENFTVFNFQSLLANRNGSIANAQMLLVLKYVDNEIMKNRDYNTKYGLHRKVVVVIDEAHVFIDTKFPVALDFMFQLAKRIRKYNGMQIVITQNIKDFVGSEEIARKSTAIINACQYSFIFSLAPNDMEDLCKLYEKAGGINETEQEQIMQAPRGQCFTVLGPQSRSTFKVEVPPDVVRIFEEQEFESSYFVGEKGTEYWEDYLGDSKQIHDEFMAKKFEQEEEARKENEKKTHVSFLELTEEEIEIEAKEAIERERQREEEERQKKEQERLQALAANPLQARNQSSFDLDDFEIPDLPEEPSEFFNLFESGEDGEDIQPQLSVDPVQQYVQPQQVVQPQVMYQVPPQVQPQVIIQQPESSKTEELLLQLLAKLTDDSIDKIKSQVRTEVEAEYASRGVTAQAAPAFTESAPAIDDDDIFGSLFADEEVETEEKALARITPKTIEVPVEKDQKSDEEFDFASLFGDDDSEDGGFDIMKLLEAEADNMETVSPIDQMLTYDETVIDITLEQLAQFIKNLDY